MPSLEDYAALANMAYNDAQAAHIFSATRRG